MGFMKGFFKNRASKPMCIKCGLHKNCNSPKMKPTGLGHKKILVIGGYPSKTDDTLNSHFSDYSGMSLETAFEEQGVNLYDDCWRLYAVNCCPREENGDHREPVKREQVWCKGFVDRTIQDLKPEKIVLIGPNSLESFYLKRMTKVSISKYRGSKFYDSKWKCWVYPLQDIEWAGLNERDIRYHAMRRDIKNALKDNTKIPDSGWNIHKVRKVVDFDGAMSLLRDLLKRKPLIAFDYEATSLKPYKPGCKIISVGVAEKNGNAWAIPLCHDRCFSKEQQERLMGLWKKVLADPDIRMVMAGLGFEYIWSVVQCGQAPTRIVWDTQLATHIIDNRRGITGLKFQLFRRFGVEEYDILSKKYISSLDRSRDYKKIPKDKRKPTDHLNRMEHMPVLELLSYNAGDALGAMWLFLEQCKELTDEMKNAYKFFMEGSITLAKIHLNGMCIDKDHYIRQQDVLTEEINNLHQQIFESPENKLWKVKSAIVHPKKPLKDIDIASLDQLKELFFDENYLNLKPTKITDKGNSSLDEEALSKINSTFSQAVVNIRKKSKLRDTYMENIILETHEGRMHPFFSLHIPVSYRSSSQMINFQNLPKRDKIAMMLIRMGILPDFLSRLVEADFSGAEVITSACYHKDPNFIRYLTDPHADMHRDNAMDIWQLDESEITKDIRFFAKNMWTFAQFYGDWYGSCGPNLWEACLDLKITSGESLREHLRDVGIFTLDQFLKHLEGVEYRMWYEKFPEYTKWKEDIVKFYKRYGYIETFFGFKFHEVMNEKQCCNYPIQGCLTKSTLIHTDKGHIPIIDLIDKECIVWTGHKWAKAIGVDRGKCQLANIHFENGSVLNCDTRHVLKNQFNNWTNFKDLKVGDLIAFPTDSKIKTPKPSVDITYDFIFGYAVGDGYYFKNYQREYLSLLGEDSKKDILSAICDFLTEQGVGHRLRTVLPENSEKEYATQTLYTLTIEDKSFRHMFAKYGLTETSNSQTKRIPQYVFQMPPTQKIDYLHGIWLSDGARLKYSNNGLTGAYGLHMCNEFLLKDIQILSIELGYSSNIAETNDGYKLTYTRMTNRGNGNLYPRETFDYFMQGINIHSIKEDNENIVERRVLLHPEITPSQRIAERIFRKYKPNMEVYRYVRISKIEILDKEENTYTMSVDDNLHQFCANGVINKNTSFHLLVYTLNKVIYRMEQERMMSKLIGQIHDSGVASVLDEEFHQYVGIFKNVVGGLIDRFDWLIIPMEIEMEISKLREEGGNFAEMEEYNLAA